MFVKARARIPICGRSRSSPALALFLTCISVLPLLVGCARQVTGGAASQQQIPSPPAAPPQPAAAPTPATPAQVPQVEAAPPPPPPTTMEASRAPALEERVFEAPPPSPPPMAPQAEPSPPPAVVPAPTAAAIPTQALSDVYFDYDQSALRADAQSALASNARLLQSGGIASVVIEGHCDERGTHAYNLVLGERRAQVVKRYLEDLGVPSERIRIVSYGKERPICTDHSEACWQGNRRAHFLTR